ncbi:MAG: family metallo-hydrolase, partial [Candidatus Hydrogenedentes bacterium]|nr:family metallo-hydrolase [Candidatus Hydrogenedentota bacterium]
MSDAEPAKEKDARLAFFSLAAAAAVALLAYYASLAPHPVPADAPLEEFSAYRAIEHIEKTALEPHPFGSQANDAVCAYIVSKLEEYGIEYVIHVPARKMGGRSVEQARVVLARIPGTDSTGAFAVDAHFDSTPYGPGAADDLSGIAAMLEAARALKAGKPLMNDVVFVFADKEEARGGGGAQAFVEHPWFQDVAVLFGLETRGTSGPGIMFETAPENGFVVRQMAQSRCHPRASSIMYDFYKRMPFGSDFGRYKKHVPGLNVAYIDDFCDYHTKLDKTENVSLASLQHHGDYTLGLARRFGGIPLDNCRAPDAVYFNTIGSHMIVYPLTWSVPLTVLGLILFAATLALGLARRRLRVGGVLKAAAATAAIAVAEFLWILPFVVVVFVRYREHALYRNGLYTAAFCLMAFGIFFAIVAFAGKRLRPQELLAGNLVWWAALLVLTQLGLPGGSYVALWPLVFGAFALGALILAPETDTPSSRRIAAVTVFAVPALTILTPALVMFSYTLTALAAPVFMMLALLLAGLLTPQLALIPSRGANRMALTTLALGIVLFGAAFATN